MRLIIRAIGLASLVLVLFLVMGGTAATPAAAHYPGVSLSGWGTATIDGHLSPGEWDKAGHVDFQANRPPADGGGTIPATLFVMNDATNLYLALKIARPSLNGTVSAFFGFDNDHDGVKYEPGDDAIGTNASRYSPSEFIDDYYYTCPGSDPRFAGCSAYDNETNGSVSATNDGQITYIEFSHPLRSGDSLHDFSLSSGQTVGFKLDLGVWTLTPSCNSGCLADTAFPPASMADIVIASPIRITASAKTTDGNAYSAGAWTNSNVNVSYTCTSTIGGTINCPPDQMFSAGGTFTASGTATDNAGNSASVSFGPIMIDKTPPVIAFVSRTPAANAAGWNSSDVTVNWSCADSLSGPVAASISRTLSTEGANQSLPGTCSDRVGNTASSTQTGINIDKTPPTITITSPQENATYLLHALLPVAYSCVDALSGEVNCDLSGDPRDTFTVGSHGFIVASSDKAGNSASKQINYRVVYKFAGYYPPVDNPPTVNVAVAGQTIPVKWSLLDVSDKNISDPGVVRKYAYNPSSCSSGTTDAIDQYVSAGSSSLEYSTGTNQFVLNWKTDPSWSGTCGYLTLELIDGNAYKAYFQFKK